MVTSYGMQGPERRFSWLPAHQLHVALTLAHVDALLARTGELLHDYLKLGPLQLENVPDGDLAHIRVVAVAPLPAAVARYAADALTQLRAALEHTVFAEVEHQLGRSLAEDEGRRLAMPAVTSSAAFAAWLAGRRRPLLPPLREGGELAERIHSLQPFHVQDVDGHPLRVLVEHTNRAKHRTPAVAATRLGAVYANHWTVEQQLAATRTQGSDDRLEPGQILYSGPRYQREELSIWPKVSIQRPHTGTWHVVMNELGALAEWVRLIAVPRLVTGTDDVEALPPQLDITMGHVDVHAALTLAGAVPAHERESRRIQAATAREGLLELAAAELQPAAAAALTMWLRVAADDQVLQMQDRLAEPAQRGDRTGVYAVLRDLVTEAAQRT